MVLKDKKKFQCGDSHEGLLQPPRGSKGRCGEAEGAIKNRQTQAGHPFCRFSFLAQDPFLLPHSPLPFPRPQAHKSPHWNFFIRHGEGIVCVGPAPCTIMLLGYMMVVFLAGGRLISKRLAESLRYYNSISVMAIFNALKPPEVALSKLALLRPS